MPRVQIAVTQTNITSPTKSKYFSFCLSTKIQNNFLLKKKTEEKKKQSGLPYPSVFPSQQHITMIGWLSSTPPLFNFTVTTTHLPSLKLN